MTEAFLHYMWQHQLFDKNKLCTTEGLPIEILKPGEYNSNAGPDFFSAHIRINHTLWVGTVEIHTKASEWKKHRHELDGAYDNCILHVVFEYDADVYRKNGEVIYCLELKSRFADTAWENYQALVGTQSWVPCSHRIREVDDLKLNFWLDLLAVERLKSKSDLILKMLMLNNNDWEETFYQYLCAGFGFQINSLPFLMLSRSIPFKLVQKHRERLSDLEALFFGCAGFLGKVAKDTYSESLQKDFKHFSHAYSLKAIDDSCWKFLRLRPVNFPTVRLAQLASVFSKNTNLFSQVLEISDFTSGKSFFNVQASAYWDFHFMLGKKASLLRKSLGIRSIESIFINAVIPVLFAYGLRNDSGLHRQRALDLLEEIEAEDNSVVRNWSKTGVVASSALQSQALLELKKNYCSEKKCLTCRIGIELINKLP
ncbi:MAG: DUF2851 family protein [Bacteroidia bacterium]|nr:DUF2851 family protein [Bacteroidia bacterium]